MCGEVVVLKYAYNIHWFEYLKRKKMLITLKIYWINGLVAVFSPSAVLLATSHMIIPCL